MQIDLATETDEMLMHMSGRFDFTTRNYFIERANEAIAATSAASVRQIKVDLSAVDYIDSAALGMLLLLRDRAKQQHKTVVLAGPSGTIKQIIKTAQFDKLFTIH